MVEPVAQGRCRGSLAVNDVGCRWFGCAGEPGQHVIGVGVCRERVGLDDFRPDWHVLTVDLDGPRSFGQVAGAGSLRGEADDQDGVTAVREQMPQMVEHPAARGHAGG